jgi:hypothetical protein
MTPNELRSKNMIDAAIKHTAQLMAHPLVKTPEQICLDRANARRHDAAIRFAKQLKLRPCPPNYNEAVEELYPILRQEFNDWSKDDLATLACMVLAITAVEQLRENSII